MGCRQAIRRSALGTVVPAVLLFAGTASPAAATCGDYVHVLNAGQRPDAAHDAAPGSKSPCNGPNCREAPPPAAPAQPPPTSVVPSHDALITALAVPDPPPVGRLSFSSPILPRLTPESPFRPPRA